MLWRLEHPVGTRSLPLQDLHQGPQVPVGRRTILVVKPMRKPRDVHHRCRHLAHERRPEQEDILFRHVVLQRVDRPQRGCHVPERTLGHPGMATATPGSASAFACERHGVLRLPRLERADVGVRSHQALQHRRAGTGQAGDQHDLADGKFADLRTPFQHVSGTQAVGQHGLDLLALQQHADRRQFRLIVDRRHERLQRRQERLVTEFGQSCAPPGVVHHCLHIQPTHRRCVPCQRIEQRHGSRPIRSAIVRGGLGGEAHASRCRAASFAEPHKRC